MIRGVKFYTVGLIGIVVQFAAFSILLNQWHLHYAAATALAVELAVLHNFAWHSVWTWADRRSDGLSAKLARLVRFNLTTGLVSLAGNLFSMHLLAGWLQLSAVLAAGLSLVPCAMLNFVATDRLVFRANPSKSRNCVTL